MTDEPLKVSNEGSFAPTHDREAPPAPRGENGQAPAGTQAKEQAQEIAGQAKQQAQQVAGQAKEHAQAAAEQAKERAAEQVDEKSTQVGRQVGSQGEALSGVADELRRQGKDGQADMAEKAAEKVKGVGDYLEQADGQQLVSSAQKVAQENPAAAAAVAAAAGFAAGRVIKASQPDDAPEQPGESTRPGGA